MHISLHTSTSRKTIFWWTVQSTASPSSGTIRITREGDKDIWRSNHFTSRTFCQKLVHLAKCEGRFVFFAEWWWPRETRLRFASSSTRRSTQSSVPNYLEEEEDILVSVVSFSRQKWVLFLFSCPVERLKCLWTHREILTSIRLVHLSQKSAEIEKIERHLAVVRWPICDAICLMFSCFRICSMFLACFMSIKTFSNFAFLLNRPLTVYIRLISTGYKCTYKCKRYPSISYFRYFNHCYAGWHGESSTLLYTSLKGGSWDKLCPCGKLHFLLFSRVLWDSSAE